MPGRLGRVQPKRAVTATGGCTATTKRGSDGAKSGPASRPAGRGLSRAVRRCWPGGASRSSVPMRGPRSGDDPRIDERRDPLLVETEVREHLAAVLSEQRRRLAHRALLEPLHAQRIG